jgi:hypothetical protein
MTKEELKVGDIVLWRNTKDDNDTWYIMELLLSKEPEGWFGYHILVSNDGITVNGYTAKDYGLSKTYDLKYLVHKYT